MASSNAEAFVRAFIKKEEQEEAQQEYDEQHKQGDALPDAPPPLLYSLENIDHRHGNGNRTNASNKKAKLRRKKNAKRRATKCRRAEQDGYWKFWCQFCSADDLDAFRKSRGLYMQRQRSRDRLYMTCTSTKCPYKMLAVLNEYQKLDVYERNVHNHKTIRPIRPIRKNGKKQRQTEHLQSLPTAEDHHTTEADKNNSNANKLSSSITSSGQPNSIGQQQPRLLLKLRWSAADEGFLPDRSSTSSPLSVSLTPSSSSSFFPLLTPSSSSSSSSSTVRPAAVDHVKWHQNANETPMRMASSQPFQWAKCGPELGQIATEWRLLLKKRDASYLFVPQPGSKALADGVLLALTDHGNHIRMDEFLAVNIRKDKVQWLPKELGHAALMRLVREQCARLFSSARAKN